MKRTRILSFLLACILVFTLCPLSVSADEGAGNTSAAITVTGVTLDESSLTMEVGENRTLTATVSPSDAPDTTVGWSSSNESVVTVNAVGKLSAVSVGTATITVTTSDGGFIATCDITVSEASSDLNNVVASTDNATLEIGEKTTVVATTSPSDAEIVSYDWSMTDDSIATISGSGMTATVTAVAPGETSATVTATDKHGNTSIGTCTIRVSGITLSQTEVSLNVGQSTTLTVYRFGAATNYDTPNWDTSHTSVASVGTSGKITGRSNGTSTITVTLGSYSATCEVTVQESRAATIEGKLSAGTFKLSEIISDLTSTCQTLTGESLAYISSVQVPTKQGTLYNNYVSASDTGSGVASSQRYYLNGGDGYQLSDVTFVPKDTFSGTAEITYNGFTVTGVSYSGSIEVTVEEITGINYTSDNGDAIRFQASDFAAYCQNTNQRPLKYITFTLPSSKYGTLYYNYTGNSTDTLVNTDTKYYRTSSPNIDNVAFAPNESYSGTFTLSYTGYDTSGYSYNGKVSITVSKASSSKNGTLSYSGRPGRHIYFKEGDFSDLSYDETGYQLDYVRFTLPASSKGTLYYNNSTPVDASTDYYYSGSNDLLKNVNFVSEDDFSGIVRIAFRGYNTRGKSFSGTVEVDISDSNDSTSSSSDDDLTYRVRSGERVYFDSGDFSDVSFDHTGYQLDYVRFSIPSSSKGILYYDDDTKITDSNTSYYRTGSSRRLSDVSFVADDDYTGTMYISFTGYDTRGKSFSDRVKIIVSDTDSDNTISYSGRAGQSISFNASDFSSASYDATNNQLDYVRFSIPSSSKGVLYCDGEKISSSSTSLYYSGTGRLLKNVTFTPDSDQSGTISFSYKGYNTRGASFSGTVEIKLTSSSSSSSSQIRNVPVVYSTSGQPVTFQASDFTRACSSVLPSTLTFVRFVKPDPSVGKLYGQYTSPLRNTPFNDSLNYSVPGSPSLSQVTFVPKAGFTGSAILAYTATDASGNTTSQSVTIAVTTPTTSEYFTDMGNATYAIPAVDFLHKVGIVNGTTNTTYGPAQPLRRGAFLVMMSRAFSFPDAGTQSFADVPQDSYYARAIASAKSMGIISGDSSGNFYPEQTVTRQAAAAILYRCMAAQNSMSAGSASDLSRFTDANQVSSYAIEAMGALVRDGIFTGSADNQLAPRSTLTRAQMAVILHRALT